MITRRRKPRRPTVSSESRIFSQQLVVREPLGHGYQEMAAQFARRDFARTPRTARCSKSRVTIPTEQMLFGAHVKQSLQNGSRRRIPSRVPPASLLPAVQYLNPNEDFWLRDQTDNHFSAWRGNIARDEVMTTSLGIRPFWLSEADACAQSSL